MSTCADVGSFIESKTSVVQASNVGFTSEVSDYLVVHTGPGLYSPTSEQSQDTDRLLAEPHHVNWIGEHLGPVAREPTKTVMSCVCARMRAWGPLVRLFFVAVFFFFWGGGGGLFCGLPRGNRTLIGR